VRTRTLQESPTTDRLHPALLRNINASTLTFLVGATAIHHPRHLHLQIHAGLQLHVLLSFLYLAEALLRSLFDLPGELVKSQVVLQEEFALFDE
jgi:hypothetical protein